jgi:hypothetical protein
MRTVQGLIFGLLLASGLRAELPVKAGIECRYGQKITTAAEAEALRGVLRW